MIKIFKQPAQGAFEETTGVGALNDLPGDGDYLWVDLDDPTEEEEREIEWLKTGNNTLISGAGPITYIYDPYDDRELLELEEAILRAERRAMNHAIKKGWGYDGVYSIVFYEVEYF